VIEVLSSISAVVSFISSVVSGNVLFLVIGVIALLIFIVSVTVHLVKDNKFRHNLFKVIRFIFTSYNQDSYIKELKLTYNLTDRKNIVSETRNTLVSKKSDGLVDYADIFSWSKNRSIEYFKGKIESISGEGFRPSDISLEKRDNKYIYILSFDPIDYNEEHKIGFRLKELEDEHYESTPYLGYTIKGKTKVLILNAIVPIDEVEEFARLEVYTNNLIHVPIFRRTLRYDSEHQGFYYKEKLPMKNYKYLIRWKHKNENNS